MLTASAKEKLLLAVHASLSKTLDLSLALQQALFVLREYVPADGVFANILLKDKKCAQFLAHSTLVKADKTATTIRIPDLLIDNFSYTSRKTCLVVDDIRTDPVTYYTAPKVVPDIASYIMLRLMIDGQHVGVVCFYSKQLRRFTQEPLSVKILPNR